MYNQYIVFEPVEPVQMWKKEKNMKKLYNFFYIPTPQEIFI